jgi:hypothetical protein
VSTLSIQTAPHRPSILGHDHVDLSYAKIGANVFRSASNFARLANIVPQPPQHYEYQPISMLFKYFDAFFEAAGYF